MGFPQLGKWYLGVAMAQANAVATSQLHFLPQFYLVCLQLYQRQNYFYHKRKSIRELIDTLCHTRV